MLERYFVWGLMLASASASGSGSAWATPILSEVFYDAEGPDAPFAFTEIVGDPGTSLEGWSLVGVNGSSGSPYRTVDLSGGVMPDDGVFVVATASAAGDVLVARDLVGDVDWQNGPDVVELWNALGELVDAVQYGDLDGPPLGEGAPAPDPPSGLALARDAWLTDTGDNFGDFAVLAPTPGFLPERPSEPEPPPLPDPGPLPGPNPIPTPMPEPSPVAILAGGLVAFARARR